MTKATNIKNIQKISKANVANIERTEQQVAKLKTKWYEWLDHSTQSVFAHTLEARLKKEVSKRLYDEIVYKNLPTIITSDIYKTSPIISTNNLPKVSSIRRKSINFSFGKTLKEQNSNFNKMIEAKKVLMLSYTHSYVEDNVIYNLVQLYLVAPELKDSDLPCIYKLDILTKPDKTTFYGARMSAVVGGCVDGFCNLMQIGKATKDCARLFSFKSEHTNENVDYDNNLSNDAYDVTKIENIDNVFEICDYAFKKFNITSRIAFPGRNSIYALMDDISSNSKATTSITGSEIIKVYLDEGIKNNEKIKRQWVYSMTKDNKTKLIK